MVKLSCKSCGAKLELTEDIDRFTCVHCGSEWLVNRSGGIISLKALEENLEQVERHTEATSKHTEIIADEIRIKRIREMLPELHLKKMMINMNPQKDNPTYEAEHEEYTKQYNEYQKEGEEANKQFWEDPRSKQGLAFSIIIGIISFAFYPSILKLFYGNVADSQFSGVGGIFIGSIIAFIVTVVVFIPFQLFLTKPPSRDLPKLPSKYILDVEQQKINEQEKINIQNEINSLQQQLIEMERKI